jgi:major membrane immunogen (membrane-anchored lipoprotein)
MKRFKVISTVAVISLLALVGCSNPETATIQTNPNGSVASAPATTSTTGNKSLLTIVSKTKTAVTSGNFVEAKKEFDEFEDAWEEVEDGIKAKSRNNYETIETNLDEVTGELKASKPQKEKLMTALQSLEKTITAVSKS